MMASDSVTTHQLGLRSARDSSGKPEARWHVWLADLKRIARPEERRGRQDIHRLNFNRFHSFAKNHYFES